MSNTDPPINIRAHQSDQILELVWPDHRVDRLPYLEIRANCPCASCQDEWTGKRILDPASIAPDIRLEGLESVGNYAVRLVWSDGHGSGLYTWETLRAIADTATAKSNGTDPPATSQD